MPGGCVYILTNRKNGALYTGVCADVRSRMTQHKVGTGSKFCAEYGIDKLVHVEFSDDIRDAIAREKAIKKWNRADRTGQPGLAGFVVRYQPLSLTGRPGDGSPLSRG